MTDIVRVLAYQDESELTRYATARALGTIRAKTLFAELGKLRRLKQLDLRGTRATKRGVEELKARLPRLKVETEQQSGGGII